MPHSAFTYAMDDILLWILIILWCIKIFIYICANVLHMILPCDDKYLFEMH